MDTTNSRRVMSFYVGAPSLASSFLFGSDGNSLLDPGVAVEQREHEASHVSSSHCAAWRLTIVVRHKVSLMGQKLLSCKGQKEYNIQIAKNPTICPVTCLKLHDLLISKKLYKAK